MVITENLLENIIQQLDGKALVRVPASEAEYLAIADHFPHKIEYHASEIIAMGLATPWHEALVMNIGFIFNRLFGDDNEILILSSNTGIHVPRFEGGYYMPDVVVVKGGLKFKDGSNCIITNPYLIVEVLLPSTIVYDFAEKLVEYKKIPGLAQILFVSQHEMSVMSFIRTDQPNTWLNQDFREPDDLLPLLGAAASLKDVYRKIQFGKAGQ